LCALRKSQQATAQAERRVLRKAQRNGKTTRPATLELACYVLVFTTVPASDFSAAEVLELYRSRWQIELHFKRLKSLAQLGHLPKHDEDAARAWLYGKLLLALLSQKLARQGRDFSPWGYSLAWASAAQHLAPV
jgi:transposase